MARSKKTAYISERRPMYCPLSQQFVEEYGPLNPYVRALRHIVCTHFGIPEVVFWYELMPLIMEHRSHWRCERDEEEKRLMSDDDC